MDQGAGGLGFSSPSPGSSPTLDLEIFNVAVGRNTHGEPHVTIYQIPRGHAAVAPRSCDELRLPRQFEAPTGGALRDAQRRRLTRGDKLAGLSSGTAGPLGSAVAVDIVAAAAATAVAAPAPDLAPPSDVNGAMEMILAPALTAQEFLSGMFRRQSTHVQRGASTPTYFENLLSSDELKAAMQQILNAPTGSQMRSIRLHKTAPTLTSTEDGKTGRNTFSSATDLSTDAQHIIDKYERGDHSVVMTLDPVLFGTNATTAENSVAPALAALVRKLSKVFGSRVSVNVYMSAPTDSVLPPHTDRYDVLILQLRGSKKWRTCTPKATGGATSTPSLHSLSAEDLVTVRDLDEATLAELYEVKRMRPKGCSSYEHHDLDDMECTARTLLSGDTLYLPKGVVHAAKTGPTPTAHLTISIPVDGSGWDSLFTSLVSSAPTAASTAASSSCAVTTAVRNTLKSAPRRPRGLGWRKPIPTWLFSDACLAHRFHRSNRWDTERYQTGELDAASSCFVAPALAESMRAHLVSLAEAPYFTAHLAEQVIAAAEHCGHESTAKYGRVFEARHLARAIVERATEPSTFAAGLARFLTKSDDAESSICSADEGEDEVSYPAKASDTAPGTKASKRSLLGRRRKRGGRRRLACGGSKGSATCASACSGCWRTDVCNSGNDWRGCDCT